MCHTCNNNNNSCHCRTNPLIDLYSSNIIYDGPGLPRLNTIPGNRLTSILYNAELALVDIYSQLDIYKKEVVILTADTTLDVSYNGKIIYVTTNPGITITIPAGLTQNIQFTFDTNIGFTIATAMGVTTTGNTTPVPYLVPADTDIFVYFTATNQMRLKKLS